MNVKRLGSLAGILFPILGVFFVFLLALYIPGYSHVRQYVSEIGEVGSPVQFYYSVFLLFVGVLLVLFSLGLYPDIKKNKYSWVAPLLLSLVAVFFIGLVAFPCRYGCVLSSAEFAHGIFWMLCAASLSFVPLFFWIATRKDRRWKSYGEFNLIMQGLGLLAFVLFFLVDSSLVGLLQRISLFVYFVWIEVVSVKLFKLSRGG